MKWQCKLWFLHKPLQVSYAMFIQTKDKENTDNRHDVVKRQSEQNCQCKDGSPGPKGAPGNEGEKGMEGKQGHKGDTGPPGQKGDVGHQGSRGKRGFNCYTTKLKI